MMRKHLWGCEGLARGASVVSLRVFSSQANTHDVRNGNNVMMCWCAAQRSLLGHRLLVQGRESGCSARGTHSKEELFCFVFFSLLLLYRNIFPPPSSSLLPCLYSTHFLFPGCVRLTIGVRQGRKKSFEIDFFFFPTS